MTSTIVDLLVVEAVFLATFVGIIGASTWHKDKH
jgi:hypothetical protein